MKINNLNDNLIISEKIHNCYLMYTSKEYYLFKPENDSYSCIKIRMEDSPNTIENAISDDGEITSKDEKYSGHLSFLKLHLEMIGIDKSRVNDFITKAFYDLAEIEYFESNDEENDAFDRIKRFEKINDEKMISYIKEISAEIERNEKGSVIGGIHYAFENRKGIKKAIRDLGNYLNTECGIILRINSHDLYKLDIANKGYNSTSIDEIIADLDEIFGDKNLFKTTDVENAVDFISERLTPEYDIVKFDNGLYDMKQHKLINPNKPIFTLIESPFNYNPDAKPIYIHDYLNSTFERDSKSETENEIKGVLQVIGYLFTSGNIYNALIFLIGIGGAGKGTLSTIIAEIFKGNTTQLDFSKIEKDTHATSILIGKHLNLVRESRTGYVDDNTIYKLLSGNDPIDVNPKNQTPYELPSEEVPKSLMNNNNLPIFKNPDVSLLQRFVLIEFKKIFRNTDDDIRDYAKLITNSKSDMEWLIYNSLNAYKEMVETGDDFILRLNETDTLELVYKHSKPLNYLIRKLILKHDAKALDSEVEICKESYDGETKFISPYIIADELNRLIVYLSKKEGIQIPLDEKTGKASSRKLLNAIKDEFDLFEYYITNKNGSDKKYTTVNKRINGKQQRIYPELIKTTEYNVLLSEMEISEKENKDLKEIDEITEKIQK